MKYTAAAVAAALTWISAAALAAPVFDGSTLQNGALKALPQDTEHGQSKAARNPEASQLMKQSLHPAIP